MPVNNNKSVRFRMTATKVIKFNSMRFPATIKSWLKWQWVEIVKLHDNHTDLFSVDIYDIHKFWLYRENFEIEMDKSKAKIDRLEIHFMELTFSLKFFYYCFLVTRTDNTLSWRTVNRCWWTIATWWRAIWSGQWWAAESIYLFIGLNSLLKIYIWR